jgi:hypothetical protein
MQDEKPLDVEDTGAVTLAICQVRTAQCVAVQALDVVVVRIVRPTTGNKSVQACAACREAMVGAGRWRLTPRSARAALDASVQPGRTVEDRPQKQHGISKGGSLL